MSGMYSQDSRRLEADSDRWATEDPNPGEKIAEDERIKEVGEKAIAGMLDEELVEAAQTLRALEDGDVEDFYPIEASKPEEEVEAESSRPTKRIRNGSAENGADAPSGDRRPAAAEGIFSADTIDNLRFYAEMTRKQAEEDRLKQRKVPPKPAVASLLGGYGSDGDSD